MKPITETELEAYIAWQQKIEDDANEIIAQYIQLAAIIDPPEAPYKRLGFEKSDDTTLYFDADEYGSYGYHEHHTFELPIRTLLLNDKDREEAFRNSIQANRDARLKREAESEQRSRVAAEAKERETFEKLKAKFEGK